MRNQFEGDTLPLFLYGTLRPGGGQHHLVAPYVQSAAPARLWGRLYHVPAGYPAVEVPEESIRARGTKNPEVDLCRAASIEVITPLQAAGDWGWVQGEFVELREPAQCLPLLDDYEDFRPEAPSLYERVLVGVDTEGRGAPAWVYTKKATAADFRIPGGIWNPASYRNEGAG